MLLKKYLKLILISSLFCYKWSKSTNYKYLLLLLVFCFQIQSSELASIAKSDAEKQDAERIDQLLERIYKQEQYPVVICDKTKLPIVLSNIISLYCKENINDKERLQRHLLIDNYDNLWSKDFIIARTRKLLAKGSMLTVKLLSYKKLYDVILQSINNQNRCINLKIDNWTGQEGFTPLMYACLFSKVELATCLIKAGADLDAQSWEVHPRDEEKSFQTTPLMYALEHFTIKVGTKIVEELIKAGADPNITSRHCIFDEDKSDFIISYHTAITKSIEKSLLGFPSDFLKVILSSPKLNRDEPNLKREFKKLVDSKSDNIRVQKVIELLRKAGMKD